MIRRSISSTTYIHEPLASENTEVHIHSTFFHENIEDDDRLKLEKCHKHVAGALSMLTDDQDPI